MSKLVGMKEICSHTNRSVESIKRLVKEYNFPAKMILGLWESDTDVIDAWRKKILLDDMRERMESVKKII